MKYMLFFSNKSATVKTSGFVFVKILQNTCSSKVSEVCICDQVATSFLPDFNCEQLWKQKFLKLCKSNSFLQHNLFSVINSEAWIFVMVWLPLATGDLNSFPTWVIKHFFSLIVFPFSDPAMGYGRPGAVQKEHGAALLQECTCCCVCVWYDKHCQFSQSAVMDRGMQTTPSCQWYTTDSRRK